MSKEKDMNISMLLDFYGELLPDHQREAMEFYYNDDMSLAEISEDIGISRQGVRDRRVKGESALQEYESKLGLVERFSMLKNEIKNICDNAEKLIELDAASNAAEILESARSLMKYL